MSRVDSSVLSLKNVLLINDPLLELRQRVLGTVITESNSEYDTSRAMHSFASDARPLAIVQVRTAEDVAATVDFARQRGFPLTIRSGGHGLSLQSVVDDAIVIDFRKMNKVTVDPRSQTARVQAGATSGDVIDAAQPYDLALSTGDTQSVGIGGLTTGGGIGFMVRKFGLTIDNLLSAQVVLADGAIVTASADENPDLFWAIRGGGGNVAVVTEFTFRLAKAGTVVGGVLALPATYDVVRGYLDYAATAPDDLTTIANLMLAPPAPFVPAELVGQPIFAILVTWSGGVEESAVALEPLRRLAAPIADTIGPIPYRAMYEYTAMAAERHASSVRMMFADDISDATIYSSITAVQQATSPFNMVQFRGMGGAMARVDPEETAFANRSQPYFVAAIGIWMDPSEDGTRHRAWTESLWEEIRADCTGVYVNFLEKEGDARIHQAYPGDTYERLAEIKRTYDPGNLFRFNQNIPPRA